MVAKDGLTDTAREGYAVVNINLEDVNDEEPAFDICCLEGSVEEHSAGW